MRSVVFALILVAAAASVVVGVAHWSHGAAWVAAGVLGALLGWTMLADSADEAEQ
jgi:hypothetical protein